MPKSKAECLRVLGLPQTADEKDIKDAYRRKALELHPDKNPDDPAATERFQELQEAYTYLMKEEDDDSIGIPEWLIAMMRAAERERRRRELENLIRFGFFPGFFFEDDDDDYPFHGSPFGFRRTYYTRQAPGDHRFERCRWESNEFENQRNTYRRANRPENTGSRTDSTAGCGDGDSSTFSSGWLPEQPKQDSTRSARQKKKKNGKKKKKNKKKAKEQSKRPRSESGKTRKPQAPEWNNHDSDQESVNRTMDSDDTNIISSEEEEEEDDDDNGIFIINDFNKKSKNENPEEKMKNDNGEDVNSSLKTEKIFSYSEKGKQGTQNGDFTKNGSPEDIRELNSAGNNAQNTVENGYETSSQSDTNKAEKMKVKVENVGTKKCTDEEINGEASKNTRQLHNNMNGDYFESSRREYVKISNSEPLQTNFLDDQNISSKINDEYFINQHAEEIQKLQKQEARAPGNEDDWSDWKFPAETEDVTNAAIAAGVEGTDRRRTTSVAQKKMRHEAPMTKMFSNSKLSAEEVKSTNKKGDEEVPKSTNKGKGGEDVPKSTNKGKGGEEVPKSTNKGKGGEDVPKSTNKGKGGEDVPKSTNKGKGGEGVPKSTNKGKGGEDVPKSTNKGKGDEYKHHGLNGHQNGKSLPSVLKATEYKNIRIKYSEYINKHIDVNRTTRYKKLIRIARQDTSQT